MARKHKNSAWFQKIKGLLTNFGLVKASIQNERSFRELMEKYESVVIDYLTGFLIRNDQLSPAAAGERARSIMSELIDALPSKLAAKWREGKVSFRDLLLEGVHESYYRWHKLAVADKLFTVDQERQEWLRAQRTAMLSRTRERLQAYQRENARNSELSFAVFRLWEDREKNEPLAALNDKLATIPGMKPINQPDFRQKLKKARDLFGKFLFEEVEEWTRERAELGPEKQREAFEELDLMDEYAMHSQPCRLLLGLELSAEAGRSKT